MSESHVSRGVSVPRQSSLVRGRAPRRVRRTGSVGSTPSPRGPRPTPPSASVGTSSDPRTLLARPGPVSLVTQGWSTSPDVTDRVLGEASSQVSLYGLGHSPSTGKTPSGRDRIPTLLCGREDQEGRDLRFTRVLLSRPPRLVGRGERCRVCDLPDRTPRVPPRHREHVDSNDHPGSRYGGLGSLCVQGQNSLHRLSPS